MDTGSQGVLDRRHLLRLTGTLSAGFVGLSSGAAKASQAATDTAADGRSQSVAPLVEYAHKATLSNPEQDPSDGFGSSVALSEDGTTAVIGTPGDIDDADRRGVGEVYVFSRSDSDWNHTDTLTNPDPDELDIFGVSVDISRKGETVAVGAAGETYLYAYSGDSWDQTATLSNPDPDPHEGFGRIARISLHGETVVVSAPRTISGETTVHVFSRDDSGWTHTAALSNPEPDRLDLFGSAIAINSDGTTVVVGAYRDSSAEDDTPTFEQLSVGEVYVFQCSGGDWEHTGTISNPEPGGFEDFGSSVAVSGDGMTAVIGARGNSGVRRRIGEAYVFTYSEGAWHHVATLANPEPDEGDTFGDVVALNEDGTTVIVGDTADWSDVEDVGVTGEAGLVGTAYAFTYSEGEWHHTSTLSNPEPNRNDTFGSAVAISPDGTTALIGAPRDEGRAATFVGEAYIFGV